MEIDCEEECKNYVEESDPKYDHCKFWHTLFPYYCDDFEKR